LRVLKHIAAEHSLFSNSVEQLTKGVDNKYHLKLVKMNNSKKNAYADISLDKIFHDLFTYTLKIQSTSSVNQVLGYFDEEIIKMKIFSEPEIFLISPDSSDCFPLNLGCNSQRSSFVKNIFSEGIIDWIKDQKSPKIIRYSSNGNHNANPLNCLIIPLFNTDKFWGVLSLLTPLKNIIEESIEYKSIITLLGITLNKVQYELQRNELNKTYSDLQTMQSKLSNDFKLAALGELSYRSIEEIASPLQVILSYAEILSNENPEIEESVIETIKKQVMNIRDILNRLSKFTEVDNRTAAIQSCALNNVIKEFKNLIDPTLYGDGYECILDLEENIPPILSNNNMLKQLLINSFSLINPLNKKGGGIIISTRYASETIILSILFTDHIDNVNESEREIGIKLLKNIMAKHEGSFSLNTSVDIGSNLTFNFPLKRKIRK